MSLRNYIDAEKVERDVAYSDSDLDSALLNQSSLNLYYGIQMSKAQHQVDSAKNRLEILTAQTSKELRDEYASVKEKVTEKRLETEVLTDKCVQKATEELNKAKLILNLAKVALDSMNQRHQMVIQSCKRAELELSMTGTFKGKGNSERAEALLAEKKIA